MDTDQHSEFKNRAAAAISNIEYVLDICSTGVYLQDYVSACPPCPCHESHAQDALEMKKFVGIKFPMTFVHEMSFLSCGCVNPGHLKEFNDFMRTSLINYSVALRACKMIMASPADDVEGHHYSLSRINAVDASILDMPKDFIEAVRTRAEAPCNV